MRSDGQVIFVSMPLSNSLEMKEPSGSAMVQGDWNALGGEPLFADGETLDSYFQGNWGSRDAAIQIARNTGGG